MTRIAAFRVDKSGLERATVSRPSPLDCMDAQDSTIFILMDINDLLTELESLTDEERAKIADRLLERLARPDSQLDAQWADLAHQRLSELRDDTVDGVPASEVLGRISHRFAQFADFVESRVAEGRSGSDSEVIRTGLRLREESEARLQAIRQAVADGFSSGSPERFDVDEFIAEKTGNPARG